MADIAWLMRRLKAMSIPEVMWRISQKLIQKNEQKRFKAQRLAVTATLFNQRLSGIKIDADKMHLNLENRDFGLNTQIPLLGGYDYKQYKMQWNAGFQTGNTWPDEFSYSLEYKQRDDVGDARTNWELNRHFQFALLAKDYAASGEEKYLNEFRELFEDWNEKNPFLWGISWTSVMEVAIRCSNWCYTYCFLRSADAPENLLEELRIGIVNMTEYVANHYSRFSSANNHLIVEAYSIGQTGVLCEYKPWIKLAVDILTRELPLQNYSDGVNKELSLHYQSFYMEAMGLMMRLLIKNSYNVPSAWKPMLEKMCTYVADCMGDYGETVVFGDDDEGKILDLQGGLKHYQYVLGLFSCLLDQQYTDMGRLQCENLNWLFSAKERNAVQSKQLYRPPFSACYKEGGNTILRSKDNRILIGIDHAALGFGSIAAHGHADALSFQMYVSGQPVFVDPGTYIYHCDLESRNAFRRTENHNTVCVNGKDQSEMLGAFLWGRKAKCELISYVEDGNQVALQAKHNGYNPYAHLRTFKFDERARLEIADIVSDGAECELNFVLSPEFSIKKIDEKQLSIVSDIRKYLIVFEGNDITIDIKDAMYSEMYGTRQETKKICVRFKEKVGTVVYL